MSTPAPLSIAARAIAGDTWRWTIAHPDADPSAAGVSVRIDVDGAAAASWTAAARPATGDWLLAVPAPETGAIAAGTLRLTVRRVIAGAGPDGTDDVTTLAVHALRVETASGVGLDRDEAELVAVQAALQQLAESGALAEYGAAGRTARRDLEHLRKRERDLMVRLAFRTGLPRAEVTFARA